MTGLIGIKLGMTRLFSDEGHSQAVTIVSCSDNRIAKIKTSETDGYEAIQVAFGQQKANRLNKSRAGHFSKSGVSPAKGLKEFRLQSATELSLGDSLPVTSFEAGQKIDVTGVTIGKGFAGGIKRHHFSSNRASHGNSVSHRAPGSIGMAQDPGRVFKGKKMAGHLGSVQRTTQNLTVLKVDSDRSLIWIKGALPGSKSGVVVLKPAVKSKVR